jgi:dsRNA-specific ribonuclease
VVNQIRKSEHLGVLITFKKSSDYVAAIYLQQNSTEFTEFTLKTKKGESIYVGKTIDLKTRFRSFLRQEEKVDLSNYRCDFELLAMPFHS